MFGEIFFTWRELKATLAASRKVPEPKVQASPPAALLSVPPRPPDICTPAPVHRSAGSARTLLTRSCAGKLCGSLRCKQPGLFVTDWHTQHGTGARFPPRRCQPSLYKLAALGGSGVVTGGVNRRGGAKGGGGSVRFFDPVMQERWNWWDINVG